MENNTVTEVITFRQAMTAFRDVHISVKNMDRLKELSKEWVKKHGGLTLYDLQEDHFEGIVSLDTDDIDDWQDEIDDEFYQQMEEHGIQTDEE
jgi:hypothetical protein